MTIITKPISEKKPLEKPLVLSEGPVAERDPRESVGSVSGEDVEEAWLSASTRRRVSTTTTVCAFLMALIVMSLGIIGGVYLYREFAERKTTRFQGWCGIPYEKSSLNIMESDKFLGANKPFFKGESNAEWMAGKASLFKEEFDLDLETGLHEEVFVPNFGDNHEGRFIHDFGMNLTGIMDLSSNKCYVMPLDRKFVLPPSSLSDIIHKMWLGYYNVDTEVVRNKMRVVKPPIKDVDQKVGKFISQHCRNIPTYNLVPINEDSDIRKKRSTDKENGQESVRLVEFAGKNIMQFDIVDYDEEE